MGPIAAMTRRQLGGVGLLLVNALGGSALVAQPRLEKTRLVIAAGGKAAFQHLPLIIAEQLGYFKAEGLSLEVIDFSSGPRAMQAITSGVAEVCAAPFEQTIQLQSKNRLFQSFVMQGRAPQFAFGVSTRTVPYYKSVADLRGKRIGVWDMGSSNSALVAMVLQKAGVTGSEVSLVDVGNSATALMAVRTGQIDAVSHTDPVMTMLEQKGDVKIISDTRTLKGTLDVFGGPMPACCLYASGEFIQKNPNTCQALTHAVVHALKWLQTAGPGDIIKTVPEAYLLGDRALYLASFNKVREAISLDGLMPPDGASTALRAMAEFDAEIRGEKIDLGKTYTNSFAGKAKERFKA